MAHLEGPRCLKKRGDRERLSARSPHVEALLRGLDLDPEHLATARRAGNNLWAERNRFDIDRRAGGLFVPNRLLGKNEADRRLRAMLAELSAGGGR